MPGLDIHRKVEQKFGLEKYHWVSELMDSNAFIFGPIHRLMPPHDPLSGLLLYFLTRDPNVLRTHILHNITDLVSNPSYVPQVTENIMRFFANIMTVRKYASESLAKRVNRKS